VSTASAPRLVPLRLVLWRARLPVAALLIGCACAVVVGQLRPPPTETTPVLVAAHALDAGARVAPGDVRVVRVATGEAPDGAPTDAENLPTEPLVVPVPAGLPLVAGLFAGAVVHGPPGTVVAPVRLADPAVAALLAPGMVIDVLAGGDGLGGPNDTGRVLARRALVLTAPGAASDTDASGEGADGSAAGGTGSGPIGGGLLGGDGGEDDPALVLLAVSPDEGAALAGASGWSGLSAVFVE
jgi:hypothetical protein